MALIEKLTAIAKAIRYKTGRTEPITLDEMPEAITSIITGDIDTSNATATAGDLLEGKTAYVNGELITGTIPIRGSEDITSDYTSVSILDGYYPFMYTMLYSVHGDPPPVWITVTEEGLVIAETKYQEGIYPAGTSLKNLQLPVYEEQTIIPGTSDIILEYYRFLTGPQTIKGDANLIPENIVSGVSIFGIEGAAKSGGITDVWIEEVV